MENCQGELAVGAISKGFPARVEIICVVVFNLRSFLKAFGFTKAI